MSERPIQIKYDDASHRYWINDYDGAWLEVPSVSTYAKLMYPAASEAMAWWGMRVGFAGVVAMMNEVGWAKIANANTPDELIRPHTLRPERQFFRERDRSRTRPKTFIEAWVQDHDRDVNKVRDETADRGTGIHQALEDLAIEKMPDPLDYPLEHRGWIAGLCQWWLDQEPEFLANEVMVASRRHHFAGRFDTIVAYQDARGRRLTDLKTSKRPYLSHLAQLVIYSIGYAETFPEEPPFEGLDVLWVTDEGTYELVPCHLTPDHVIPGFEHARMVLEAQTIHPGF
jgi:hypothetical protein